MSSALERPDLDLCYADTLELPVPVPAPARLVLVPAGAPAPSAPGAWERDRLARHVGAQYQVVRELGRGGMGVVFLARDVALHRLVAIKVLREEFARSEEHRERFRREARTSARLGHPGIVPVYAFGETGDLVHIVMKYVHGESLAERLRRTGPVPAAETARILAELAMALDYAHGERVVHRDLKPENVLIEHGTGRPMLTDFGVALLRSLDPVRDDAAHAFGTPQYMSPEQAVGELDIDGRSDIYALGVLGYQMLTGRPPFEGSTFAALAAQHVSRCPAPLATQVPDAPLELAAAIDRCLRKERDARWRTGRELAEALAGPWRSRSRLRGRMRAGLRRGGIATTIALVGARAAAELGLLAAALRAAFTKA